MIKKLFMLFLQIFCSFSILLQKFDMENQEKTKSRFRIKEGRWTGAQQKNFIAGLEKYGNNWEKIQKKIKTRSIVQVRSHAQKFFLNMSKSDIQAYIGCDQSSEEPPSEEESKTLRITRKQTTEVSNQEKRETKNRRKSKCKKAMEEDKHQTQEENQKIEQTTFKQDRPTSYPFLIAQPINYERKQDVGPSYFSEVFKIWQKSLEKGGNFMLL